jgi:hypothetical protein
VLTIYLISNRRHSAKGMNDKRRIECTNLLLSSFRKKRPKYSTPTRATQSNECKNLLGQNKPDLKHCSGSAG